MTQWLLLLWFLPAIAFVVGGFYLLLTEKSPYYDEFGKGPFPSYDPADPHRDDCEG